MAEAFVRTIARDCVRVGPCPDGETVMPKVASWITRYNEVHQHKVLGCLWPRKFIADRPSH
jgi:putative transposase